MLKLPWGYFRVGRRVWEEKRRKSTKQGVSEEVNEEPKFRPERDRAMRAGKGEVRGQRGLSWNQKTQRMLGSPPQQ